MRTLKNGLLSSLRVLALLPGLFFAQSVLAQVSLPNGTVGESADVGIDLGYADGNLVADNHVASHAAGTTTGIDTTTTQSNLFFRNFCAGHVFDFMPNANDTYGPAVTNAGELATSGAAFHPWANFTR